MNSGLATGAWLLLLFWLINLTSAVKRLRTDLDDLRAATKGSRRPVDADDLDDEDDLDAVDD